MMIYKFAFIFITQILFFVNVTFCNENGDEGNDFIFHHISDDYKYTFFETEFNGKECNATIYLPIILITKQGFKIFSSRKLYGNSGAKLIYDGFFINDNNKIESMDDIKFIDISITKNVLAIFFSAILLIILLCICSLWYYLSRKNCVPSGFVAAVEVVFLYICEDIIKPNLGEKYKEYLPYLMTLFFFILINNLLGLLPGAANVTGDISVTACLAIVTFLYTNINGNKHYWEHTFKPDVPKFLYPIMIPIEFISLFTKPFTLLIRLFANMTSGHIILLSIINLGFMFQSYFAGSCGVLINCFMIILKIVVAFLQAYIFTLLSAIYIGGAVKDEHKHKNN